MAALIVSDAKLVDAPKTKVWKALSGLTAKDLETVKSLRVTSQKKTGKGTKRQVTFEDGTVQNETVLDWKPSETLRLEIQQEKGPVRSGQETFEIRSHDLGTLVVHRGHYDVGLMDRIFRARRIKRSVRDRLEAVGSKLDDS